MRFKLLMLFLCLLLNATSPARAENGFVPLFNGRTLDGWTPLPGGTWKVSDGAIVGSQDSGEKRHGILLSQKQLSPYAAPCDDVLSADFAVSIFRTLHLIPDSMVENIHDRGVLLICGSTKKVVCVHRAVKKISDEVENLIDTYICANAAVSD